MKFESPPQIICHNPFEWFEIHPDGQVFACCPAWLKRPLGNLLTDDLDDIWNGSTARDLRRSIHDGSFRHCNRRRCPRLSKGTAPVGKFSDVEKGALRDVFEASQTRLPWGPQKLNLCYDRSCNLACSTCRPGVYVASEEERRQAEYLSDRLQRELAPQARQLIISGTGDPFASSSYRRLLERFVPSDYPHLKSIHLHSNGLLWDSVAWQSMQAAQPFVRTAEISIDAASAETYSLNRGGDFDRLLDNLTFLARLPIAITLSFVVQQNNYREMADFVTLAQGFGFAVYFSQLVNWGTFRREEFRRRALHLPDHPEHAAFRALLNEVAGLQGVDIGNLRPLLVESPSSS
jgi:MoaA/NifB/PqqE/SkfB family radical SAM enzyme